MDDYVKPEQIMASTALPEQPADDAFDPNVALGRPKRRTRLWVGGIVLLVALLGSASFLAARMLMPRDQATEGGSNVVLVSKGGSGATTVQKSFSIEPAKELPSERATTHGVFLRREDNSIFVGTGNIRAMGVGKASGETEIKLESDGPEVEIVVTHDTQIWADVTPMRFDKGELPDGNIQQVVKPGSLDEVDQMTTLQVWGERKGDRVIAGVLAYHKPG